MTRSTYTSWGMAILMAAASMAAVVARPDGRTASAKPAFSLDAMIPKQFGDWREEPQRIVQVVNPQAEKVISETYSQTLSRTYVNGAGYQIMLSLAYSSDERGPWRAHEPEYCYAGAGFTVHEKESAHLATSFGEIPIRRLFTSKGPRVEPLTYWVRVGDKVVRGWQWKLVELGDTLRGRVPDGLIFRVSSIDTDRARANQNQDLFINQLLHAVSPIERKRLSGLGEP
ncbi:MAG TPA: EpsI family protein [Burkholderiales bacterium]|nr:EpsI family protein [Burkholderiales bacterium]